MSPRRKKSKSHLLTSLLSPDTTGKVSIGYISRRFWRARLRGTVDLRVRVALAQGIAASELSSIGVDEEDAIAPGNSSSYTLQHGAPI